MTATVPFFGGYGQEIPQQGLPAGSRLPILAPRPSDLSPMGQNPFSTVSGSHRENQVENTAPFYYPPVNMRAPETVVGTGQEVLPDGPAYHSTTLDQTSRESAFHSSSQSYNSTNHQTVHREVPHAQVTAQEATYNTKYSSALQGQAQSSTAEV